MKKTVRILLTAFCFFLVAFVATAQAQSPRLSASVLGSVNNAPTFQARYNSTQNASTSMACGDFSFATANYDAAQYHDELIGADLNNDGKTDLIATVANSGISQLKINLNNGDGTFAAAVNQATTQNIPWRVVAGDLNADGNTDLVAGHFQNAALSILLGNGDGTFAAAVNMATTGTEAILVLADMNSDGKLDLVVTSGANTVVVYLGNGDGTFQSASTAVATGSGATGLAVADFNGDGKKDVVKMNFNGSSASIILGNGDGTLQTATTISTGSYAFDVITADFNADGKQDMVYSSTSNNRLEVRLGNGDGTFAAAVNYTTGSFPRHIGMGDMDGDGFVDLAVANSIGSTISIFEGNGDGTFQAKCDQTTAGGHWTMYVGNLDGRGNSDFAFHASNTSKLNVYKDPGPAAVTTAATSVTGTSATANGTITPNGKTILSAEFRYGTDPALTSYSTQTVNVASVGTGTSAVPVSASLGGLSGNTTYYFRLVATYSDGVPEGALGRTQETALNIKTRGGLKTTSMVSPTVQGSILSFTTSGATVTTTAATSVAATSATANGTITPNGQSIFAAEFRYGTSPTLATYSTQTVNVASVGTGSSAVPVTANLTGLAANTTYYFQLAVTSFGSGCGSAASSAMSEGGEAQGNRTQSNSNTCSGLMSTSSTGNSAIRGAILSFMTGAGITTPTSMSLTPGAMDEGTPAGTVISTLANNGIDPAGFVYTLVAGAGSTDNALVEIVGNQVKVKQVLYRPKSTLNIRVRVSNVSSGGGSYEQAFVIEIRNLNFAPVFLSRDTAEGEDCSPFIYTLSAQDWDEEDAPSFSLVDAPSWLSLVTNGASTMLKGTPSQAQAGTYTFKVRIKSGSDTIEQTMTVKIADVNHAPVFTSEVPSLGLTLHKGNKFVTEFAATDCDGDAITLKPATDLASWITATNNSSVAKGTASVSTMGTAQDVGTFALKMMASDGKLSSEQGFNISVSERYTPIAGATPATSYDLDKAFSYELKSNSQDRNPVLFLLSAPSWIELSCDGNTKTGTGGAQDRCPDSKKTIVTGTPTATNLPVKIKIMYLDDVIYSPARSCQEFSLVLEGGKAVVKDYKLTNCGSEVFARENETTPDVKQIAAEIPAEFSLLGTYPNPFNPSTSVLFNLPEDAQVTLNVFNTLGQTVKVMAAQSYGAGANQRIELNMSDLPSGLYVYQLAAQGTKNTFRATGRMTLVK